MILLKRTKTYIFAHKVRLQQHFKNSNYDDDDESDYVEDPFKLSNGWTPPSGQHKSLDKFLDAVELNVDK